MQRNLNMAVLAVLCGCGSSATAAGAAHPSTAREVEAKASAPQSPPAAEAEAPAAQTAEASEPTAKIGHGDTLPARVEAGSIPRATLVAVLSSGVGRFLQKVRAEPHLESGHFLGWRLIRLFDGDGQTRILRPGDTVLTVNGKDIERPEQFKDVWDQVGSRDELVLLVQRQGKRSELHYRIVQ